MIVWNLSTNAKRNCTDRFLSRVYWMWLFWYQLYATGRFTLFLFTLFKLYLFTGHTNSQLNWDLEDDPVFRSQSCADFGLLSSWEWVFLQMAADFLPRFACFSQRIHFTVSLHGVRLVSKKHAHRIMQPLASLHVVSSHVQCLYSGQKNSALIQIWQI